MALTCELKPISAFLSTNLNTKQDSYDALTDRILYSLGAPMVNVELFRDQIYANIQLACEFFTKYAGMTEEYLVFNSDLYDKHVGIRLDTLFTLRNITDLTGSNPFKKSKTNMANKQELGEYVYVSTVDVPSSLFVNIPTLSGVIDEDLYVGQVINETVHDELLKNADELNGVEDWFIKSRRNQFNASNTMEIEKYNPSFDYDLVDYRKVVNVTGIEQGSTTGINTLFTIEQTMAQQTYFSYAMGNYGFDLVSWYTLKNWLDVREKVLSQRINYTFDKRTQYLRLIPEPKNSAYWAVIKCWVERPLRDIIKERWVYDYSLALCKIALANVRGKYTNVQMFGGTSLQYDTIKNEGMKEKEELEKKLMEGASSGYGDIDPPCMMLG